MIVIFRLFISASISSFLGVWPSSQPFANSHSHTQSLMHKLRDLNFWPDDVRVHDKWELVHIMTMAVTILRFLNAPKQGYSYSSIALLQNTLHCKLVFPRDGTSRCPFVPGQKNSYPGVPLSRDKGRSKCPGTNSSVPARPGTKRFKNFQKKGPDFPF